MSTRARIRPIQRLQEVARFIEMHLPESDRLVQRFDALPTSASAQRVIVSLTTIPGRVGRLRPTLLSLLDQTLRPDAIVLNVPRYSRREQRGYETPAFLSSLPIEVRETDRDWGPATKLLPALSREEDPDTLILVVDDDQVYPRIFVETLVTQSQKLPDAALCSRGFRIPHRFDHASRNTVYGTDLEHPQPVEIMQGSAGFLVKPRFFTNALFDYSGAPEEAFFCDDIWIGGHLAREGVQRFVVPFDNLFSRIATWTARGTASLHDCENRDGTNNAVLYRYFEDDWALVD